MVKQPTRRRKRRQTTAGCEETLAALEAKRVQLVARGAELPELRRAAAFAAHVEGNAEARTALDAVNVEVVTHGSELQSIDDAIAAAKFKLNIAQSCEAEIAARLKAQEALEILTDFKKAGHELDDALRTVAERGQALASLLLRLHESTGNDFPTYDQFDVLGHAALATAIMSTPWAKRYRHLAPNQRQGFRTLFDGWSATIERRLQAVLGDTSDKAA